MSRPGWQSNLKNPCYDTETKTDCPKRCGGCQFNCSEWAEYVEKRDKEYEKQRAQNEIDHAIDDLSFKRGEECLKYKMRMARIKRRCNNR